MSYMSSDSREKSESLNEFDDPKPPTNQQISPNLYQKYNEKAAERRFQRSNEGIPAISQEDFKLLRECNKESFWYRCLPISVGICAVMFYLANQKNMKPKTLHILSGTFAGWFIGKLSYRRVCENRLINSDSHSPFVTAMRRRRGIYVDEGQDTGLASEGQEPESTNPYWEQHSSKTDAFDYGSQGFQDFRDEDNKQKEELFTTYDDLRAKNRSAYKPRNFNS